MCRTTHSNQEERQANVEVPQQLGKHPPNSTGVAWSHTQHPTFDLRIHKVEGLKFLDAVNQELVLLIWPGTKGWGAEYNNSSKES